ncbi:amidase [Pseudonocardia zijingensis]|jgi:aspartyl-tRNA(Asn)/glutamyl-tRNA(Gln) amidotransferase subunit A|uniref:Amidase n=1 Tax=Pseudonocardia zijingensis TaxID=153376 RepID=A0ABP3YLZ1_9PSEU
MTTSEAPASESVRHALERAHTCAHLGALAVLDERGAARAAAELDAARGPRGPLHGIPVVVKDNIDVEGLPSRAGSALLPGEPARTDATAVRRLREAGAVVLGKAAMHELAYGPTGDRSVTGPVRNPHAPDRITGGSSSGSAAAVAAGIVPVALGTDTGGSVRIPAALCGVVGFKPAHGAVPDDGVLPLARSLDVVGVLAQSVELCALAAGVLTGRGPAAVPVPQIGWLSTAAWTPVDPRVERVARAAVPAHDDVRLEGAADWPAAFTAIQSAEAYALHAERVERQPDLFDPEVLARLRAAGRVPAWCHVRALEIRRRAIDEVRAVLDGPVVIASPAVAVTAPRIGQRRLAVDGSRAGVRPTLLALTSPWNLVGLPAITVPAGTVDGLPVGVQLVALPGQEDALFAAAAAVTHSEISSPGVSSGKPHSGPQRP